MKIQPRWAILITTLVSVAIAPSNPAAAASQEANPTSAGSVISQMLLRYYNLKKLDATIVHTVSALGKSQSITTRLVFEKPSSLYLEQVRSAPHAKTWLVVSDGKIFSYPVPAGIVLGSNQAKRLIEPVKDAEGKDQDVQRIVQASADSIADTSDPLMIMAGWNGAQKAMISRWSDLQISFPIQKDGSKDYLITGIYTTSPQFPAKGKFSMLVSPNFDLLQFQVQRFYTVPDSTNNQSVETLDTWICTTNDKPTIDESLFTVPKK